MFKSLINKWKDHKFDAMIHHRVETTKNMLSKYGPPTQDEIKLVCGGYAKEIVKQNLGNENPDQVDHVLSRILAAREEIQSMFESDGYSKDFSYALSHVCVGWDWDAYKNRKLENNLTLNCMLKVHTQYNGLFNESMLLKKNS